MKMKQLLLGVFAVAAAVLCGAGCACVSCPGNAATPLGIEAMKRLKKHAPTSDTASNAMVLFVVLNTASIKLIPTTVAMLRHDAGSGAPMEIVPVSLLVSFASCTAAILAAKLLERRSNG